ncbi:hypothetical protein MLD38_011054 [Melastoma candidum]|uniref:Uncharacterized protein n=1 Tax=Melastoma candidum TaxID=119954 RepID=A0ACB9R1T6_9MYRT|nr:hypothetical protein MLD38_011054 [Melastoma candidum]
MMTGTDCFDQWKGRSSGASWCRLPMILQPDERRSVFEGRVESGEDVCGAGIGDRNPLVVSIAAPADQIQRCPECGLSVVTGPFSREDIGNQVTMKDNTLCSFLLVL